MYNHKNTHAITACVCAYSALFISTFSTIWHIWPVCNVCQMCVSTSQHLYVFEVSFGACVRTLVLWFANTAGMIFNCTHTHNSQKEWCTSIISALFQFHISTVSFHFWLLLLRENPPFQCLCVCIDAFESSLAGAGEQPSQCVFVRLPVGFYLFICCSLIHSFDSHTTYCGLLFVVMLQSESLFVIFVDSFPTTSNVFRVHLIKVIQTG